MRYFNVLNSIPLGHLFRNWSLFGVKFSVFGMRDGGQRQLIN
jgi:hypothetical protein